MTKSSTYFKLGLFIITATVILLGAIALLAGPNIFKPTVTLETYFKYSISGLEVGSPVKFRGIPVGQVKEILLSTEAYPDKDEDILSEKNSVAVVRMKLYLPSSPDISKEIKKYAASGLRVQTQLAGITGSLYLSLEFLDPQKYPVDRIVYNWKPKYGYIPSAPSLSNEIIENVKSFLARLDKLDLDKQIQNLVPVITSLIDNLNNFSEKLNPTTINKLASNLDNLVSNADNKISEFDVKALNQLISKLEASTAQIGDLSKTINLKPLTDSLTTLSSRLDAVLKNNQHDVHQALQSLDRAMSSLNQLLRQLNENPREFFMGPRGTGVFK